MREAVKLGIGDLVRSAALALRCGGRPLAVTAVLWAAAVFANAILNARFDIASTLLESPPIAWLVDVETLSQAAFDALRTAVLRAIGCFANCVFAAALLRVLLIGHAVGRSPRAVGLARASVAVLLASLVFVVGLYMVIWLAFYGLGLPLSPYDPGPAEIGVVVVTLAAITFLASRLCLVFPAAAVARSVSPTRSWHWTAGNGFRLSVLLVAVWFAYRVVNGAADWALFGTPVPDDRISGDFRTFTKDAVLWVAFYGFLLALAAVAFTRLTGFAAGNIPGSRRTPKQLAEAFE